MGFISQAVDTLIPGLVIDIIHPEVKDTNDVVLFPGDTIKALNYTGLVPLAIAGINELNTETIPLLISAINEQQNIIDSLNAALNVRLSELESRMNNSGTGFRQSAPEEETVNQLTGELSSLQVIVLDQNMPNPFKEQTSISYFVPEEAGNAMMQFTDLSGRVIKTVELEKGSGILTVFAQNLGSGTYSYSLIINGRVMETKRMVKTR